MPVPLKNEIKKSSLAPISVLFFGGNYLGARITEELLTKDSRVIVVDEFTSEKEALFINLRDNPKLLLINSSLETGVPKQINTVDYIYVVNYVDYFDKHQVKYSRQNLANAENIFNFASKSNAKIEIISNIELKNKEYQELFFYQNEFSSYFWDLKRTMTTDLREVYLPIIYGPKMSLENTRGLGKILDSYINDTVVNLNDENKFKNYYIYIEDALQGILKSMFSEASNHHKIVICDKEAHSEMEVGSILKNVASKHVEFNYYEDTYRLQWQVPEEKNLHLIGFAPKIKLKEGILKTLNYFGYEPNDFTYRPLKQISTDLENNKDIYEIETKVESKKGKTNTISFEEYQRKTQNKDKKKKRFKLSEVYFFILTGIISTVMIFIIFPIATIYLNISWAQENINQLKAELSQGNIDNVTKLSVTASENIQSSISSFKRFKTIFVLFAGEDEYQKYENLLLSLSSFSQGIAPFSEGIAPFLELQRNIIDQNEIDPVTFENSEKNLTTSLEFFETAESFLTSQDIQFGREEVKSYNENLPKLVKLNKLLVAVSKDYERFFGYGQPHKILILFQNPAEIRPTGGFIGSYGSVEISKGRVISLKIDDIYNPDGQIDVKDIVVVPPSAIQTYLNEDRYYIRNANFSPDFPTSGKNIKNLFNLAVGESFDTVIAIDYFFIKEFLNTQGSVFLSSYNEEITAENFVERAQFHSEFNYREGVSEKKSFLTTVGSKILEKFLNLNVSQIVLSANSTYNLLENKNIQVYTEIPRVGGALNNINWDGSVKKTSGDYLKVVNANLGGNKVNYQIKNYYKYEVLSKTRDGLLRGRLTLNYQNLSPDNAWPYGTYKNYLRVLVPEGSSLTGATISDGVEGEANILSLVKVGRESGYQTFELGIEVKPLGVQNIVFEYDLPQEMTIIKNQNTKYNLLWQNQPGEDTRIEFSFTPSYGLDIESVSSNKPLFLSENSAKYNENQHGDFFAEINLR